MSNNLQIKLTARMKKVVRDLNNNNVLITSNSMNNVFVWENGTHNNYVITGALFWKMVNLGIIYQDCSKHGNFNFILTNDFKK